MKFLRTQYSLVNLAHVMRFNVEYVTNDVLNYEDGRYEIATYLSNGDRLKLDKDYPQEPSEADVNATISTSIVEF